MWHTLSISEVERKMKTNSRVWAYRKTSRGKKKKIWHKSIRKAEKKIVNYQIFRTI